MGYGDHHLWHRGEGESWQDVEKRVQEDAQSWLASQETSNMPMTFTDEMVLERAARLGLPHGTVAEAREALANRSENEFGDYVEGWEIRTGRPWNTMTRPEALALVQKHPQCRRNPGVLSKLLS